MASCRTALQDWVEQLVPVCVYSWNHMELEEDAGAKGCLSFQHPAWRAGMELQQWAGYVVIGAWVTRPNSAEEELKP